MWINEWMNKWEMKNTHDWPGKFAYFSMIWILPRWQIYDDDDDERTNGEKNHIKHKSKILMNKKFWILCIW
mgnify:CR=1 FL=1